MSKLYRIRKLVWEESRPGEYAKWVAITPIGNYAIRAGQWWIWGTLEDDSGDEVFNEIDNDAAKLAAEAHWVSRVEGCLEEVK